jgi:hypothetical protein
MVPAGACPADQVKGQVDGKSGTGLIIRGGDPYKAKCPGLVVRRVRGPAV